MKDAPRIVVITGFMGAGKTTVAHALARLLPSRAVDLDDFITAREGHPPRFIIDTHGEAHFRELETAALRLALAQATDETTVQSETHEHAARETTTTTNVPAGENKSAADNASSEKNAPSKESASFKENASFEKSLLSYSAPLIIALGGGTWTLARNRALIARTRALTVWLDAPFDLCWHRINSTRATRHTRPLARERDTAHALYRARLALYTLAELRIPVAAEASAETLAARIASRLASC